MPLKVLVVGEPERSRLPAVPPTPPGWSVEWSRPGAPTDLRGVGLVVFDLTSTGLADPPAGTNAVPRVAVADGPADLPGCEIIDTSTHPDPFAEAATRLERLRVVAKVRWLLDLGGEPFVRQVLDLVLAEGPKSVAGIGATAAAGDAAAAGKLAHQFKSTAGNVGAQEAAEAAGRVEAAAAVGDVEAVRRSAGELARAWERVLPLLTAARPG